MENSFMNLLALIRGQGDDNLFGGAGNDTLIPSFSQLAPLTSRDAMNNRSNLEALYTKYPKLKGISMEVLADIAKNPSIPDPVMKKDILAILAKGQFDPLPYPSTIPEQFATVPKSDLTTPKVDSIDPEIILRELMAQKEELESINPDKPPIDIPPPRETPWTDMVGKLLNSGGGGGKLPNINLNDPNFSSQLAKLSEGSNAASQEYQDALAKAANREIPKFPDKVEKSKLDENQLLGTLLTNMGFRMASTPGSVLQALAAGGLEGSQAMAKNRAEQERLMLEKNRAAREERGQDIQEIGLQETYKDRREANTLQGAQAKMAQIKDQMEFLKQQPNTPENMHKLAQLNVSLYNAQLQAATSTQNQKMQMAASLAAREMDAPKNEAEIRRLNAEASLRETQARLGAVPGSSNQAALISKNMWEAMGISDPSTATPEQRQQHANKVIEFLGTQKQKNLTPMEEAEKYLSMAEKATLTQGGQEFAKYFLDKAMESLKGTSSSKPRVITKPDGTKEFVR